MIGLLQRVRRAQVEIAGNVVGTIGAGLVVFVGVERGDNETAARRLLDRVLGYRVFADAAGKMNLSVRDVAGGLLLVPQFTLVADTGGGLRPSFSTAATPAQAQHLYHVLLKCAEEQYPKVASGTFGADMQVTLTNDGPVTFWLETGNTNVRHDRAEMP